MYDDSFLQKKLGERRAVNAFRSLRQPQGKIDFCSNDYLGIVKNGKLQNTLTSSVNLATGSTGSRLLAGNYPLVEQTETQIAAFYQSEAALIFYLGDDANS